MSRTFGANKSIILGIILWGVILNSFYKFGLSGILNLEPVHLIVQPLIILLVGTIWFGIHYVVMNNPEAEPSGYQNKLSWFLCNSVYVDLP